MKTIAVQLILFLFGLAPLGATTYYLSGATGANDLNTGTNPASPWRTIAKLNTAALQPGDSVLFERGWTYRGQINARPGTAGNPVYYGAYGQGALPVISGALPISLTGWSVYEGAIYVKNNVFMPSMAAAEPPNLFLNGRLMLPARYPNEGLLRADEVFGANPGSNCCEYSWALEHDFLPTVFPNAADLEGAHMTGYDPYSVSTRLVNNYDPALGRLEFDTLRGMGFINRRWYFLTRKLNFLDAPGEWYYDDAAHKLSIWKHDGSAPAAGDEIEYSFEKFGISDWQVPYITVEGLEFRYQQIAGLWVIRSTGVVIRNNRFYQSKYGIHGWGSSTTALQGTLVEHNDFDDIHRVAVNLNNYIEGAIVRDNRIHNVGRVHALMQSGQPDQWSNYGYWEYGKGMEVYGSNNLIVRNRIDSTGRQAIAAGGPGVRIENNVIDCPCLNYNDCGGIMSLGSSRVEGNIIRNSYGYFSDVKDYSGQGARGIYPDFRDFDTIRYNTIAHTNLGIGLTNSKNVLVANNTVYDCGVVAFRMNRKTDGQLSNKIVGNTFFSLGHEQPAFIWDNQVAGADNNSISDSNRYWNPYNYFPIIKYRSDVNLMEQWYDLGQWQMLGFDTHSEKEFEFKNQPYRITDTLGQNQLSNGDFGAGLSGWSNTGNMVVNTNPGQLDGPCASVTYNGVYAGNFFQTLPALEPGGLYRIGFSLLGSLNTQGEPFEMRIVEAVDVNAVHYYRVFKNGTQRQEYWSVFEADTDLPLSLRFSAPNGTYFLDNVSVLPIDAGYLDPREAFPLFINETPGDMEIALPPCQYLDLHGNAVEGSIVLPPFSSRILVLDSCLSTRVTLSELPPDFTLQLSPNPSGGALGLRFEVPQTGRVSIRIYDLQGRLLRTLADTEMGAGEYRLAFSDTDLRPGVYLVRLEAGAGARSGKWVVH